MEAMVKTGAMVGGVLCAVAFALQLLLVFLRYHLPRGHRWHFDSDDATFAVLMGAVASALLVAVVALWFVTLPLAAILGALYFGGRALAKVVARYEVEVRHIDP